MNGGKRMKQQTVEAVYIYTPHFYRISRQFKKTAVNLMCKNVYEKIIGIDYS